MDIAVAHFSFQIRPRLVSQQMALMCTEKLKATSMPWADLHQNIFTILIRFIKPLWLCRRGSIILHLFRILRDLVLETFLLRLCPLSLSGSLNTGDSSAGFFGLLSKAKKLILWILRVVSNLNEHSDLTTIFMATVNIIADLL
jgi:hypothetical protein